MPTSVDGTFGKPIVTQEAMRARIRELGRQIRGCDGNGIARAAGGGQGQGGGEGGAA